MVVQFFAFFLLCSSALACPELGGLYRTCKSKKGELSKLRIVQSDRDGVQVFKIAWSGERTQVHLADGVIRATPIFNTGMTFISSAVCEDGLLRRRLATQEADGGISISIVQEYSLKNKQLRFQAHDEKGVFKDITCAL